MSLLGLFLFVFFFFPLVYLLVFPFFWSFLSFPQKYVCLCLFRFCHFHSVSISFNKISRFFCLVLFVFQHLLKTKSFFYWYLISFLVILANKKISQFKFPFWSCSFLYLCFSFLFLFLLTLFSWFHSFVCTLQMFPLSWSTLLVVTLPVFVAKHFFSKKENFLSLLCLQDLHVSFLSPFSVPLFISFCENPSVVLLLFGFVFFPFCNLVNGAPSITAMWIGPALSTFAWGLSQLPFFALFCGRLTHWTCGCLH